VGDNVFFSNYTCTTKALLEAKQTPFLITLLLLWHHLILLNVMQCHMTETTSICKSFVASQPRMHLPPVYWERDATQQNNSSRCERVRQKRGFSPDSYLSCCWNSQSGYNMSVKDLLQSPSVASQPRGILQGKS